MMALKSPWSAAEDRVLFEVVSSNGASRWPHIASFLPGRTGKQCRERWINHINPDVVKGHWSPEEDQVILYLVHTKGPCWSLISQFLPGRTDSLVKNRYNGHLKKRIDAGIIDASTISRPHLLDEDPPNPKSQLMKRKREEDFAQRQAASADSNSDATVEDSAESSSPVGNSANSNKRQRVLVSPPAPTPAPPRVTGMASLLRAQANVEQTSALGGAATTFDKQQYNTPTISALRPTSVVLTPSRAPQPQPYDYHAVGDDYTAHIYRQQQQMDPQVGGSKLHSTTTIAALMACPPLVLGQGSAVTPYDVLACHPHAPTRFLAQRLCAQQQQQQQLQLQQQQQQQQQQLQSLLYQQQLRSFQQQQMRLQSQRSLQQKPQPQQQQLPQCLSVLPATQTNTVVLGTPAYCVSDAVVNASHSLREADGVQLWSAKQPTSSVSAPPSLFSAFWS